MSFLYDQLKIVIFMCLSRSTTFAYVNQFSCLQFCIKIQSTCDDDNFVRNQVCENWNPLFCVGFLPDTNMIKYYQPVFPAVVMAHSFIVVQAYFISCRMIHIYMSLMINSMPKKFTNFIKFN